jgi:hypothetical protein
MATSGGVQSQRINMGENTIGQTGRARRGIGYSGVEVSDGRKMRMIRTIGKDVLCLV